MPITPGSNSETRIDGFSKADKLAALDWLRTNGLNLAAAARAVGTSRVTLTNHMKSDPWFGAEVKNLVSMHLDTVENVLFKCALDPDKVADRHFLLRNWRRDRYQPMNTAGATGSVVVNIGNHAIDQYVQRQEALEAKAGAVIDVTPTASISATGPLPTTTDNASVCDIMSNDENVL